MKSNKESIIELYFEHNLRVIDIANKLGISKSAVTQTLQKNDNYIREKEIRKQNNKKKNNEFTKKYMAEKRKSKGIDIGYTIIKQQHEQAVRELSAGKRDISNRCFRNWNSSIYKYNEKSRKYILRKGINVGYDVPKSINWKIY